MASGSLLAPLSSSSAPRTAATASTAIADRSLAAAGEAQRGEEREGRRGRIEIRKCEPSHPSGRPVAEVGEEERGATW